ncbi:D-ribulokinase [Aaosphaeria arxii CBS 175.79]|uniref:D-ribulokinase n=1 Tax=Aaosphaeria arxii CBS 175.79 TaxID=1450172 RepID=A0A6A5XRD8_9PLEO|nr:D-ribulokinase [Aaosphaeria arxii CBS 175.79]KAF2015742.1 D-ribulokinase [Aaosphaeria arxii CBS 175.79]
MPDEPHVERATKSHFIGVDVGTGSARACLIDQNGTIITTASRDIQQWQPRPGIYVQSTSDIWASVCYAVREAMKQSQVHAPSVGGIAFVATCSLAIFTHDTDEPVAAGGSKGDESDHNIILWMDQRAGSETDTINKTKNELLRYLGGSISILMELPKILWLKNHMTPEEFQKCRFFDLHDALTHIATGNQRFPCSDNCTQDNLPPTLPLGVDGTAKGWSKEFLEEIGLEELAANDFRMVGGVCPHGKPPLAAALVGSLSPKSAQDLGLTTDVAVGVGTIDAYSGWVGTIGSQFEGQDRFPLHSRMAAIAGTSSCYLVANRKPVFADGIWGPYQDWIMPGHWMSSGGQAATGMLIQHVMEIHPAYNEAVSSAKSSNTSIFDFLDRHLEHMRTTAQASSISYLARHYFFYGDLYGNRSPIADPHMTGSVVGLTADKSLDNLAIQYYGVLEFIAHQIRQVITTMNDSGAEITSLFMSGSVALNPILLKLITLSCDMPVIVPKSVSTSVCFGAAILSVKAATQSTDSLWSTMQTVGQRAEVWYPEEDAGKKALLDVKYTIYLEQCARQQAFRGMVDAAIAKHPRTSLL